MKLLEGYLRCLRTTLSVLLALGWTTQSLLKKKEEVLGRMRSLHSAMTVMTDKAVLRFC